MKNIMFDNRYGLTQAVIDEIKTMTRRMIGVVDSIEAKLDEKGYLVCDMRDGGMYVGTVKSRYKIGEEVAIAQRYCELAKTDDFFNCEKAKRHAGWNNKMFVKPELMPNRIRIANIKAERLQDISEEDCLREGLLAGKKEPKLYGFRLTKGTILSFTTPREAFAALINRISGRGTWQRNPWVYAYTFELIK